MKKLIKYIFNLFFYIQKWKINIIKKKEKLQKEACERYQNLSEKEKDKKGQYARKRDIEALLKKKKKRSVNMVVNNIRIF